MFQAQAFRPLLGFLGTGRGEGGEFFGEGDGWFPAAVFFQQRDGIETAALEVVPVRENLMTGGFDDLVIDIQRLIRLVELFQRQAAEVADAVAVVIAELRIV